MLDTLKRLIEHPRTERFVLTVIIVNAITLGLETNRDAMASFGQVLDVIDRVVLAIFIVELGARILAYRAAFFRDPWSLFDLFVVGIAIAPVTESLSVLRALRILRALRLVTAVPSLKRVVGGLATALPGMGSILLLLTLIFYIFSVMGAKLFGGTHPELFGGMGRTAYTLFQVMTFDDWVGGVVKPLLPEHPYAWVFFILFIVLSTFMTLNLFIGVVVSALDTETPPDAPKLTHPGDRDDRLIEEIAALRREIAEMGARVGAPEPGLSRESASRA